MLYMYVYLIVESQKHGNWRMKQCTVNTRIWIVIVFFYFSL